MDIVAAMLRDEHFKGSWADRDIEVGALEPLTINLAGRSALEVDRYALRLGEEEMLRMRMETEAGKAEDAQGHRYGR